MNYLIDAVRHLLRTNPARVIGYGAGLTLQLVLLASTRLGVEVPSDTQIAITGVATFIITELIRRLVYSPQTAQELAERVPAPAPDPGLPVA